MRSLLGGAGPKDLWEPPDKHIVDVVPEVYRERVVLIPLFSDSLKGFAHKPEPKIARALRMVETLTDGFPQRVEIGQSVLGEASKREFVRQRVRYRGPRMWRALHTARHALEADESRAHLGRRCSLQERRLLLFPLWHRAP